METQSTAFDVPWRKLLSWVLVVGLYVTVCPTLWNQVGSVVRPEAVLVPLFFAGLVAITLLVWTDPREHRRLRDSVSAVPWGNLFRWIVTTQLFVLITMVLVLLSSVIVPVDVLFSSDMTYAVIVILASIPAAVVVWSEEITWPGDPEHRESPEPTVEA